MKKLMFLQQAGGGSVVIEDTVSGNPIVFTTDLAKPLRRLALTLLPKQSGTGGPSPENIRPLLPWGEVGTWQTGGNLLDDSKRYSNEMTIYIGRATSAIQYTALKAGTYTISADMDEPYGMYYREKDDTANRTIWASGRNIKSATFTIESDGQYWFWLYRNTSSGGVDPSKLHTVMLNAGETALPYVPYSPITPHPVNLRKNLYPVLIGEDSFINNGSATHGNENGKLIINTIASSSSSGVYLNTNSRFRKLLDDVDGQTVTLSLDIQASENASVRIVFCGKQILFDVTPSTRRVSISETVGSTKNFNIYGVNSGATLTVSNVQLEQGEQATAFQPYIPPVYGCSVDLTTGEVWGTWAGFSKKWSEGESATDMGSGITRKAFSMVDYLTTGLANNFCNIVPYSANENAEPHFYYSGSGDTNKKCRVFLPSDTPDDTEITVITKLKNPVLLATLTPQQINALIGVNTVWSDADGIELTYLKKG